MTAKGAAPLPLRQHVSAVVVLGVPLVASNVAQFLINLTDTIVLGWYSLEALAAATLAHAFYFLLYIFGAGFAAALMPLVAEAVAQQDERRVRRATRMGLWLALGYVALVVMLLMFAEELYLMIGQNAKVSADAQDFLEIMAFSLFPAMAIAVFRSFLAALGHTGIVLWATVASAVLNAIFVIALVFGIGPLPEMGIRGAALGSLLANSFGAGLLVLYITRKLPEYELFVRFWRPDWAALRKVFRIGVPIGFTSLAESALFSVSALIIGRIGTAELAAHGIVLQVASATFMIHIGLSQAATIRAGLALGLRDEHGLRQGAKAVLLVSMLFGAAFVVLMLIFPSEIVSLFLREEDPQRDAVLAVGISLMAMAALFQMFDAAQVVALGLLRGVQDTAVPMVFALISYWGVGMPTGVLLGLYAGWGAVGVWAGLVMGLAAASILMLWRFWTKASRISTHV